MGIFSWVRDTAQSLALAVMDTVKEFYRSVSVLYGSKTSFLSSAYAYAKRFLSGYRIILGVPTVFYKKDLHRARHIMAASATSFIVFYLGALLFYEAGFKKLWRYTDNNQAGSGLESAADVSFYYLMVRTSVEMSVNCMLYNLALYKAVNSQESVKPPYPQGANNLVDKTLAGLASTAYYFSNLFLAKKVVKAMLVHELGHSSSLVNLYDALADTLLTGASLAEYQLGGLSTNERSVIFANNKVAHMGIGFALYTMRYLVNTLVNYLTGLPTQGFKGYFVDEAIFNVVYQLFIVAAMTTPLPSEKPESGEESGLDLFSPGRAMVQGLLKNIGEKINRSVQPKSYELIALPEAQQQKSIESITPTQDKVVFVISGNKLFSVSNKAWAILSVNQADVSQLRSQFKPTAEPSLLISDALNKFFTIAKFNPNKLWKHAIRDYFNHPYWRLVLLLFVPGSVRSDAIFDKTACRLFFEENLKTYLDVLEWITGARNSTLTVAAVGVINQLPNAVNPKTEAERESYKFLFAKGLEPQLVSLKDDFEWINQRIQRESQKGQTKILDKQSWLRLAEDKTVEDADRKQPEPKPVRPLSEIDEYYVTTLAQKVQAGSPTPFTPALPVAEAAVPKMSTLFANPVISEDVINKKDANAYEEFTISAWAKS